MPDLQKQLAHWKLRCEELQELTFEKEKTIASHVDKLKARDTEAVKELEAVQEKLLLKEKEIGEHKEKVKTAEKVAWEA